MNPSVLENILILHAQRYPAMEEQDYVKLLCQSELGPAHLLSSPEEALSALREEFAQAKEEGYAPAYTVEAIGGGLCRFHLNPQTLSEDDLPLLCRCFAGSAYERGSVAGLCEKLGFLSGLTWRGGLPLDREALDSFLALYTAMNCPTLHHSGGYREAYRPHYRVMDRDLALYFPALRAIDKALREENRPILVAVDGRCGAGKTTFAARCAQVFGDCSVLHMDDFFLPPDKRTPERLSTPGGNVDYERAEEELFAPLSRGGSAAYRPFDCAAGDFGELIGVPCARPGGGHLRPPSRPGEIRPGETLLHLLPPGPTGTAGAPGDGGKAKTVPGTLDSPGGGLLCGPRHGEPVRCDHRHHPSARLTAVRFAQNIFYSGVGI